MNPITRFNKKTIQSHRLAYIFTTGEVLNRMIVIRHKCDNRICCNPNHLEPGTHADNVHDWQTRLIDQKGEHNFASKLTENQVNEIRNLAFSGIKQSEISKKYNISTGVISMLVHGKAWKHSFDPKLIPQKHLRLSRDQVKTILFEYKNKISSQHKLAERYKVSSALISLIVTGKRYKNYASSL